MKLYKLSVHRESEIVRLTLTFIAVVVASLLVYTTKAPTQAESVSSPVSTISTPGLTTPPSAIDLRTLGASTLVDDATQARLDAEQAARDALQDKIDAQNDRLEAEAAAQDAAQHLVDLQNEALTAQQEAADAAAEALALAESTPAITPTTPADDPVTPPVTPPTTPETPPTPDTPPTSDPDPTPAIPGLI